MMADESPVSSRALDDGMICDGEAVKMPVAEVLFTTERGWRRFQSEGIELWIKGWPEGLSDEALLALGQRWNSAPSVKELKHWLASILGHFAFVMKGRDWVVAAVDRIRSIPLVWAFDGACVVLSQEGTPLVHRLKLGPADCDHDAIIAVALAGFTIGNATVFKDVRQLGPGQFLLLTTSMATPEIDRYHRFAPWCPVAQDGTRLRRRLSEVTLALLEQLVGEAAGRPIAVPLSAGRDSRLIVSGLVYLGHKNIITFAYGLPGNHEAKASKIIAERLGLPWCFVPYSHTKMSRVFRSPEHLAYVASADSLTGIHFPQEYLALRSLKNSGYLPGDALLVNGQSGDFITGNHIPAALCESDHRLDATARRQRITNALIAKHYKQWKFVSTEDNMARIEMRLSDEIDAMGGMQEHPSGDHGVYEWCEFQDRQSKFVVNGQRVYEFLGYDWRLPLWGDAYLDFWQTVPLEAKAGQRLYNDMLTTENWGGVWTDIPLNVKAIRPNWIRPIRLAAKAIHAPLGQASWHEFQKRYLYYWMDNLAGYTLLPWWRVAADGRGHVSGLSWHIEAYLAAKGHTLESVRAWTEPW